MSLLPMILQHELDDLFNPSRASSSNRFGLRMNPNDYYRPLTVALRVPHASNKNLSQLAKEDEDFQVNLDVQEFSPDELKITMDENVITVEGKHEEKVDEAGLIYRHFVRKFMVPDGHNLERAVSNLSSNGTLTITAPRKGDAKKAAPVVIPIQRLNDAAKENGIMNKQ